MLFCICMSWYSTYELDLAISCSASTASVVLMLVITPSFFLPIRFDLHEIQSNSSFVSLSQKVFSFKCVSVSVMVNVFSLFANWDINCTLCFCFFVLSQWMLQLIIEYKLVCPRKQLELDSLPISYYSIVVVHCASPPIKKYYGHSQLCPFVLFAGTHLGYWGVGLGWDDDEGKSRIVCLGCESRGVSPTTFLC